MQSHRVEGELKRRILAKALVVALMTSGFMAGANAQEATERKQFAIPPQPAAPALNALAEQADITLVFSQDAVAGMQVGGLEGEFTTVEALAALLQGTGLTWQSVGEDVIAIEKGARAQNDGSGEGEAMTMEAVVVTGTRIRGATIPSPLIAIDQEQMREEGYTNLGDVIRSIPQNFSGGQNPGVALAAGGGVSNQNINSGSAINLRGLGPDATLTLLNGRRLSYSGFGNAIDVSIIPIAALKRIEVIADGASAIYGSDAVAGVANIITKREFDGVRADYHFGMTADGGGEQRRYGLTTGTTWEGGGFIVASEYSDIDAIFAHERSYLDYMLDPNSIVPERQQHSTFVSGYQNFGDVASFSVDTVYTERESLSTYTNPASMIVNESDVQNVVVSPVLDLYLPNGWSMSLGGSYGRDESVHNARRYTLDGAASSRASGCYCNTSRSYEIGAEGPVFALPGGDARVAVGTGYRENDFESRSYTSTSLIAGERSSRYVYGEIYMPLVSPEQGRAAVHRLDVTAAFRHENYSDMDKVTTPKFGVVYQPSPDFTLKTSWGKSYKAPNLIQQYQAALVYLYPAELLGAEGYPAGAMALMTSGGNPDLEPERAESWTASVMFHPRAVPGLQLELGFFDVDYTDRVRKPVGNRPAAFRDPVYAEFRELDPSAARQAEVIGLSDQEIINYTGTAYDPAKVMGIVHNAYTNVARQRVRGVDFSGAYEFSLAGGRMTVRGTASWLDGWQVNSEAGSKFDTAGMVFNPPNFRARAGVVWSGDALTLSSFVNHLDGVTDNRLAVSSETGSFTTIDVNSRYAIAGDGLFGGVQLGLSIHNLLDRTPPLMTRLYDFTVNYDSTNYSAIGRFVNFSISKRW